MSRLSIWYGHVQLMCCGGILFVGRFKKRWIGDICFMLCSRNTADWNREITKLKLKKCLVFKFHTVLGPKVNNDL